MKSLADVVSGAGLAGYAEIALVLFVIVFIVVSMRVLFANKQNLDRAARLPLEDGTPEPKESSSTRKPRGA